MGDVPYDGPSFRLSKTPDNQFAAPSIGEHTDMVLSDILGMDSDEIEILKDNGILQ
jgi:crotonobetainyl-CoA:carnitine CoA-transferase CaiB-like acyl-CoA transferase